MYKVCKLLNIVRILNDIIYKYRLEQVVSNIKYYNFVFYHTYKIPQGRVREPRRRLPKMELAGEKARG